MKRRTLDGDVRQQHAEGHVEHAAGGVVVFAPRLQSQSSATLVLVTDCTFGFPGRLLTGFAAVTHSETAATPAHFLRATAVIFFAALSAVAALGVGEHVQAHQFTLDRIIDFAQRWLNPAGHQMLFQRHDDATTHGFRCLLAAKGLQIDFVGVGIAEVASFLSGVVDTDFNVEDTALQIIPLIQYYYYLRDLPC